MIKITLLIGLVFSMMATLFPVFSSQKAGGFALCYTENVCEAAKTGVDAANNFSASGIFSAAKLALERAAKDGREHSVTFGKDTGETITASPVVNGDTSNGKVIPDWQGAFADLHNHCNHQPPSAGDLYYLVKVCNKHASYRSRFVVTPGGVMYALYLYDLKMANDFVTNYPMERSPGYSPRFPEPVFDVCDLVSIYFEGQGESRLTAQERAMAFILSKYYTGVALLKQDMDGHFKIVHTEKIVSGLATTYVAGNCR
jgi:hypothetical protein